MPQKDITRNILVTNALIYANGDVHLGHLVGHIQADIWVRFQRMRGNKCTFLCGSDTHGTPIMLKAQSLGISPEELVNKTSTRQKQDFIDFQVIYDNFHSTNNNLNQELVCELYQTLKEKNLFDLRDIEQLYDEKDQMFLPDRFVKGTCPKCKATDQYGDSCENCGATYNPTDLIDPKSVTSNTKPILKTSEHYFFKLPELQDTVSTWLKNVNLSEHVKHKLSEWFESGLKEWDVSRDKPYFGFEFPDHPGKYFYVWLDAPVGYIAASKDYASKNKDFSHEDFWINNNNSNNNSNNKYEIAHFIGKDIVYFHAIFWPALLASGNYNLNNLSLIHVNGFLTINHQKMSKSRGTFVNARDYLNHLDPAYLRYYFAAKLSEDPLDIDLSPDDFAQRVNTDLINKYINIASRSAGFIKKLFDNKLSENLSKESIDHLKYGQDLSDKIADLYEKRSYSQVMKLIMQFADHSNQYIDFHKPWSMAKSEDINTQNQVQEICTVALNDFRLMSLYLKPVLPKITQDIESFLNIPELNWEDNKNILLNHSINSFKPLLNRIKLEDIEKFIKI
jgi:methionyl-tRNA synthetase